MTHKQLSELIILSCKKAMKEEMAKFKQEILSELRQSQKSTNPLVEQQKKFRQQYRVQQPQPKQRLSSNPTLNELLRQTEPIQEGYDYEMEDYGINLPTRENGQVVKPTGNNKALNSVVNAMNRDYSALVKRMDEDSGRNEKQQLRNKVMNIMENDHMISNNSPMGLDIEPFDEDMSWLNDVE